MRHYYLITIYTEGGEQTFIFFLTSSFSFIAWEDLLSIAKEKIKRVISSLPTAHELTISPISATEVKLLRDKGCRITLN